ncbi:hypothetical protein GCM10007052_01270 [Halioglobus japonicus]|nr:hypothetical protein GCM10007052_01270 [Halioglobus japonicus]
MSATDLLSAEATMNRYASIVLILSCMLATVAQARPPVQVKSAVDRLENTGSLGEYMVLPYAFAAESTDTVLGVGGMRKGFYQDQMLVGGIAFAGEESWGAFAGVWDYNTPWSDRLFVSVTGMLGYYPQHRAYTWPRELDLPPDVIRPGANDSSEDLFLESSGDSNWWEMRFDYVLPTGKGRDSAIAHYELEGGLLVSEGSGGPQWNPLEHGVTVATLRQYNRYQSFEYERAGDLDGTIHAFELGLLHDNTDFPINPSQGSWQYMALHHDPAWLDSEDQWTFVEAEAAKYVPLGEDRFARQRVLALNAWTGYSPSWRETTNDIGGVRIEDAPPYLEGASLGGFYRMRGYRDARFHDKASIYASAELRYTLRYNPVKDVDWLRFLRLDWFQLVGFVEGGRVAPDYDSELLEDWHSDVGLGLRAMTGGIVVRFDVGWSDEGSNAWVMVGHPF